jgi:hypothetical protein
MDATTEQLDRIEAKLDEMLAFRDFIMATTAPFLSGKGAKYLALFAKAKGGSS